MIHSGILERDLFLSRPVLKRMTGVFTTIVTLDAPKWVFAGIDGHVSTELLEDIEHLVFGSNRVNPHHVGSFIQNSAAKTVLLKRGGVERALHVSMNSLKRKIAKAFLRERSRRHLCSGLAASTHRVILMPIIGKSDALEVIETMTPRLCQCL